MHYKLRISIYIRKAVKPNYEDIAVAQWLKTVCEM